MDSRGDLNKEMNAWDRASDEVWINDVKNHHPICQFSYLRYRNNKLYDWGCQCSLFDDYDKFYHPASADKLADALRDLIFFCPLPHPDGSAATRKTQEAIQRAKRLLVDYCKTNKEGNAMPVNKFRCSQCHKISERWTGKMISTRKNLKCEECKSKNNLRKNYARNHKNN